MGRKLGCLRQALVACVSGLPEEEALLEVRWVRERAGKCFVYRLLCISPTLFVSGWWSRSGFFLPILNSSLALAELSPLRSSHPCW